MHVKKFSSDARPPALRHLPRKQPGSHAAGRLQPRCYGLGDLVYLVLWPARLVGFGVQCERCSSRRRRLNRRLRICIG